MYSYNQKYCDTYHELKSFIIEKNIELFDNLGRDSTSQLDIEKSKLMNEIVIKIMDLEWSWVYKPNLSVSNELSSKDKFFKQVKSMKQMEEK